MVNHRPDQPDGRQPTLLADYLLAEGEGPLFLIACKASDIYWPEESLKHHEIITVGNLSEAKTRLSDISDLSEHTGSAVLNIQDIESDLEPLIGLAVRTFPHRLIVYTLLNKASDALFFSFGFKKLNVLGDSASGRQYQWYEFRLSHYKQPPDWLNARFWANPERFGLDEDEDLYDDVDEEE